MVKRTYSLMKNSRSSTNSQAHEMKFAPFYNTDYDIGQPENNFGNSQSPGSLLSPSVPPFPTSWETLQVVCRPIGLSIVACCCCLLLLLLLLFVAQLDYHPNIMCFF